MSEDTSEMTLLIYISVCCFFQLSVSLCKCTFMQYSLKQGLTHNPTLRYGHLNFVTFFVFHRTHICFLPRAVVFCVVCHVGMITWWKGFLFPAGWSEVKIPSPLFY
jgi:hypothetical protein